MKATDRSISGKQGMYNSNVEARSKFYYSVNHISRFVFYFGRVSFFVFYGHVFP